MSQYTTDFASIDEYESGSITVISEDNKKNYVFSNMYEVAAKSAPYERVAVAKNFEYVIESTRAEGTSPWYTAAHDEFAVAMDYPVTVELVKLEDPDAVVDPESEGAHKLSGDPQGPKMGTIKLSRGHMALLPVGAAYRFSAESPATLMIQTIDGPVTQHKWAEFCHQ
ncbi:hypothetical protein [Ruegeria sp. MALMAid1280]|uniref:hypothetical protein n=1 Tax=Ruegeria sp. MALMAid1280 TaxID=3411634 RepID=UPI003B9FDC58